MAFGLGLLALLPLLSKRHWQPLELPRSLIILLGFVAILMIQVALDRVLYPQQALVGALYILWAAFLLWLGHELRRALGLDRMAGVLAWALLIGALFSCALGLLQHFGVHTPLDAWINRKVSNAIIGNLGQPNHLANYLALGLASLLYLMANAKLPKWLGLPLALLVLLVLALTGARTSWLYLGAFVVLAAFWRKRGNEIALTRWIFPITLLLLPTFALMQWLAHLPFMQGISGTITPADRLFDVASGLHVRLDLWREAAQMLLDNPGFGVGFGQFAWQHFQHASAAALGQSVTTLTPSAFEGAVFNHSHNLLAQISAEFGLSGLLLLIVGSALWLWGCVRQPATRAGWWIGMVLAVIVLHSFLEYPLWYANFLGIAAILIGAADTHTLRLKLSSLLRIAFGLMLILSWIGCIRLLNTYTQLEGLLQDRQVKMTPLEVNQVLQQVRKESLLAPYSDFAYALSIVLNRNAIDEKLELNFLVMRFAPTQEIVYQHAVLLGLQGNAAAGKIMLKRALVIYPAGASKLLQTLASLPLEDRTTLEPLRETAYVFLQEQKQDALHTK